MFFYILNYYSKIEYANLGLTLPLVALGERFKKKNKILNGQDFI